MISVGLLLAVGLAILHSFLVRISLPHRWISQAQWLSFAGGVSITYVFLEVFPELSYSQTMLAEYSQVPALAYIEHHAYLLALIGLVLSYGLNSYAAKTKSDQSAGESTLQASQWAFWLHITSFAVLNSIVGYLLQNLSEHSLTQCVLFFVAMALHFFIIDHHLREHHERLYDRGAAWLLTGAIITGAIVGQVTQLSEARSRWCGRFWLEVLS